MLMQSHIDKHAPKTQIVAEPLTARRYECNPEPLVPSQQPCHKRPGRARQRPEHTRDAHHGGSLLLFDDRGDECRARGLVHVVEPGAQEEECDGEEDGGGEGEAENRCGGGDVREDHGVDEAEVAGEGCCEDGADG